MHNLPHRHLARTDFTTKKIPSIDSRTGQAPMEYPKKKKKNDQTQKGKGISKSHEI